MTTSTDDKKIEAERKAVLDLARQFARDILLAEGFYTRAAVAVAQQFLEADAEREDLRAQIKQAQLPPIAPQGETPRTDALLHERRMAERESEVWDVVDVEAFVKHARQIEREISDMTAARDRTVRLLDEAIEENTKLRGEIAEAIERIADLKSGVEEANQRWLAARSAIAPLSKETLDRAADTLRMQQEEFAIPQMTYLTIDFWRARAVYLAEQIVRAPRTEKAPTEGGTVGGTASLTVLTETERKP